VRLVNFSQQGDKPLALKIRRFAHNKEFEQSLVSGSSGFNRPTNVRRGLRRGAGFRSIRRCREIHHRRRWSPRSDPRHGRDLEDLSRLRSEPRREEMRPPAASDFSLNRCGKKLLPAGDFGERLGPIHAWRTRTAAPGDGRWSAGLCGVVNEAISIYSTCPSRQTCSGSQCWFLTKT
jgi:hypothetical protein